MPIPSDRQSLERFLGMVNYVAKFLPHYSEKVAPLRNLLKKDNEWCWGEREDRLVSILKQALCEAPVLALFEPAQPCVLSVDASSRALGAVILQDGRPVEFASATLTDTQQRYAQIEKEMLAIVFALERFHQYVFGKMDVVVETDHKPLEALFKKSLDSVPARLQRMMLRVQRYDFSVVYKPGKYMFIADTLSRAPLPELMNDKVSQEVDDQTCFLLQTVRLSDNKMAAVRRSTKGDKVCQDLINYIKKGWPSSKHETEETVRALWDSRECFEYIDGVLFRNNQVYIPTDLRSEMVSRVHEGHLGIDRCKRRAREVMWWPAMSRDVEQAVRRCRICAQHAPAPQREPMVPHPIPGLPWSKVIKSSLDFIKTQLCVLAISLTLFNLARLPREAFRYGTLQYLLVYSAWLVLAALPASLLQLTVGQLSQQDPVGVWRAVPILRGVGHLKVMTSYICCVYIMMYVALSTAYLIWIGKGSFPLKDCTKLQITPDGYENKMNATECFNSTFLAPFTMYPQYLGIMAIIIFILWFFLPILLYRLRKSLKVALSILGPVTLLIAIVMCIFLSNGEVLFAMLENCEQWHVLFQPFIWHSAMVQALLSTQVAGGYLISAGGTIYRHSDVRWTSMMIIIVNLISGWLWVFFWVSIGGEGTKDTSFVSILVLIYQSSVTERRNKEWPLLAFGIVALSGTITVLLLLFPVFSKFCRTFNDHWRLVATTSSAVGTALTVAVLINGLKVATVLDELVVPVLAAFTTALEIVGFVFIYGWHYLKLDVEFLTGTKLPWIWLAAWALTPILLVGTSGWWLRTLLSSTWDNITLWPMSGVFFGILLVLVVIAAVAVAKEEQFNLTSKIASSFRPSRLWGPEEPMARYVWMSQRITTEHNSETNFPQTIQKTNDLYPEGWLPPINSYEKNHEFQNGYLPQETTKGEEIFFTKHKLLKPKKLKKLEDSFKSSNTCIAKTELGGPLACNCNRHFTLNVPDLRKTEVTTSL